jgi:hypothetical protein
MENLPWLFGAFTVAWALVFGYLAVISKWERDTRKKIVALRELMHDGSGDQNRLD